MEFNIEVINLKKYYLVVFCSVVTSFLTALIVMLIFKNMSITFLSDGNYSFIVFIILSTLFGLLILNKMTHFAVKNLNIKINNSELIFDGNQTFLIENIEEYKINNLWSNFPLLYLKTNTGNKYKFRFRNRVDDELDFFIEKLNKILKNKVY